MSSLLVAKVGGSLFDLRDLRDRLRRWTTTEGGRPILFIPGGGATADVIRQLDAAHGLTEETAHWLAVRALSMNAHFLSVLLDVPIVESILTRPVSTGVLDAHSFLLADEGQPGSLEHKWNVTSDAIAARVAQSAGGELALLKSTDLPRGCGWPEAAEAGLVDPSFPRVVAAGRLRVSWVNLRRPEFGPTR
jgi:5-(aminomethyl)-3-furanmethanol phosphate kinase